MSFDSIIRKRLKEARLQAGLSQKQLGIAAGIDEFSASPRINQYEKGKHSPDYKTAERLAKVLGIPVSYLYEKSDELAQMILLLGDLTLRDRKKILSQLTKLANKKKR